MKGAHIHCHQACNNMKTVILFESTGHSTTSVSSEQENVVTCSGTKPAEDISRSLFRYTDNQTTIASLYFTSVAALTCNLRL